MDDSSPAATAPPTPTPVEPAQLSLASLLALLAQSDDALTVDMDPATLIGEIKGKVDSIKYVLDRLGAYAQFMDDQAAPLLRAAKAAKANHERLKTYVEYHMRQQHFDELPGERYRVALQPNSVASLILKKEKPDPEDFTRFPAFVNLVRRYEWNGEAMRKTLAEEGGHCPFAELSRGNHARFYLKTPMSTDKREKEKK